MPGALDGVRVLDLSWGIAGSLGVLFLAEQGADVIKVEPPGGDPMRSYDGFAVWNRSRRSVTVDLKSPDGLAAFQQLADTADVLVETFRPGVTDRLGIGYDALHARNERLIYTSCPAYPEGHRLADQPGYDALVQASSGQQWEQPGWRLGPIFLHMPMPSMGAMFLVPSGILAALIAREQTGRGQHVRTSLLQGAFLYTTQIWTYADKAPGDFWTIMSKSYPAGSHQQMVFEVANDEWVHTSMMSGMAPIKSQDELLGVEEVGNNEQFGMLSAEERGAFTDQRSLAYSKHRARRARSTRSARTTTASRRSSRWVRRSAAGGFEPHPQLVANGMVATVDDPELGTTTQVGVPLHLAATPGAIKGPRPRPGQHNAEIWGELGLTDTEGWT